MKTRFTPADFGRITLTLIAAGAVLSGPVALAQTVTVGGTDTGSTAPFGGDAPGFTQQDYLGEFQQIYSSSAFSGVTTIRQISFSSALPFSNSDVGGFNQAENVNYNFTVALYNTTATPSSASTTYATNKGAVLVPTFTVTKTASLLANGTFDLTFSLPSTLIYTPASGNLLLDVNLTSALVTTPGGGQDNFQYGISPLVGTVANTSGTGVPNFLPQRGLLTQFSAAPEPSQVVIMLIGASAAGLLVARRRFAANRD